MTEQNEAASEPEDARPAGTLLGVLKAHWLYRVALGYILGA